MRAKNRQIDILIGSALVYIFVGLAIVALQALSGAKCGPVRLGGDYVYDVNRDAPRLWLVRTLTWLPTAYDNLVTEDVSMGDYVSPKKCLWISDNPNQPVDDNDDD